MAEIIKPIKVGNVWTNLISNKTGESVNYEEVTTWRDGTPMDDSKCDETIYRKLPASLGGGYVMRKYTGPANVRWFGAKGDGVSDDKAAINTALRLCSEVLIPQGTYLINVTQSTASGGIVMQNNTSLIMEEGTVLTCQPNDFTHYAIIGISNKNNVSIRGGRVVGDKDTHTGSTGERGMGIWVHKGSNVLIEGVTIESCWGDGIYLGTDQDPSGNDSPTNVKISRVISTNNRRQGLSVVAAKNLYIKDSRFTNTSGTPPQAGIDIEPNQYQTVEGVVIDSCYFEGNVGSGVEILCNQPDAHIKGVNVINSTFIDNVIYATTSSGGIGIVSGINIVGNSMVSETRDRCIRINYGVEDVVVDSNKLTASSQDLGASNGVILEGVTGNVNIINNSIYGLPNAGVRILDSTNISILNNDIQGNTRAIHATGTNSSINIENNRLSGGTNSAVALLNNNSFVVVANNTVKTAGTAPIQISNASNNCSVTGNRIVGFSGTSGLYPAISVGGISVENTFYGNIVDTPADRFTALLSFGASTQGNRVYDNSYTGTFLTSVVIDSGTNNLVFPTLSAQEAGVITINSADPIVVQSLGVRSKPNAASNYSVATFLPYFNTSGSTGYPAETGVGIRLQRTADSSSGSIEIWKDATNSDAIYIRGGTQPFKRLIKEGDVTASADSASAPGGTYDQAEVQAILDELRDLKTKMRTAGLLAT